MWLLPLEWTDYGAKSFYILFCYFIFNHFLYVDYWLIAHTVYINMMIIEPPFIIKSFFLFTLFFNSIALLSATCLKIFLFLIHFHEKKIADHDKENVAMRENNNTLNQIKKKRWSKERKQFAILLCVTSFTVWHVFVCLQQKIQMNENLLSNAR